MQARFAFPKFEMTDRLENIRYRQICLHDNTDMSVSKHYVVSKSSGGGKNECKPDIQSTKNIRYRQICMHDNIDMSVSKNYVVSKSSGGGKIECKPGMHFENSRVLIVFKTSGTSKFACMIIDIHLHFQKKCASSSKPPVLANLYTRRYLIPKLCPRSNLRCRQICIQDRSIFPKICVITSLQNLRYRQICTQDRSSFPKIYLLLRLQKPPVPSNLHASIHPYTK